MIAMIALLLKQFIPLSFEAACISISCQTVVASKKQKITNSEIAAFSASLEPAMKFDPVLEIGGSRL